MEGLGAKVLTGRLVGLSACAAEGREMRTDLRSRAERAEREADAYRAEAAAGTIYGRAHRPAAVSAHIGPPVSTFVDAGSRTEPVSSIATALAAARAARDAR